VRTLNTVPPCDRPQTRHAGPKHVCCYPDLIRDLAEIGEHEAALVGGKAHSLALLMRHGFRVPKGFCITSEAFRMAGGSEAGKIILSGFLRELIVTAWRRAGFSVAAVRSSATEEDGDTTSWAGVFPTELAVEDEASLLAAVERCFGALHAPEARQYRSRHGGAPTPAMAVLVQELVEAEAAGMVFTANPVSGTRDEIVINAIHGLGCALAAGTVTGDTIVVGRDGAIRRQIVSAKPFRSTRHGVVPVPAECCELPAVCQQGAAALAKLALEIEELFGSPQDIEFAVADGRISILQARPITGQRTHGDDLQAFVERERRRIEARITALRRAGRLCGTEVVFSNGNIGELLPTPTPMSFDLFREIFAGRGGAIITGRSRLGYRLSENATDGLFELICGQPYFNLEVDAGTFHIGAPIDIDEILRHVIENPKLANYPELGLYQQASEANISERSIGETGAKPSELRRCFRDRMVAAGDDLLERFTGEIEPELRRAVAEARHEADAELTVPHLVAAIGLRVERLKRGSCVVFVMAARLGFFFAEMVRSRIARLTGGPDLTPHLLQGLEGSRITQQSLDLERLARGQMQLEEFLESHGHLAANELEISMPRMAESPSTLDALLRNLLATNRRPSEEFRHQQSLRRAAEEELRERLERAQVSEMDVQQLHVDLRLAQAFLPLRETVKYYYAAEYAVIRSLLLRLNDALGWQPEDVFYLLPEEIPRCVSEGAALQEQIAMRRREHRLAVRLARQHGQPSVLFGSRLNEIGRRRELAASRQLVGTPVASGNVVGVIRLYDCSSETPALTDVRADEVIVARSANLGLAPLMRMAAGLIVEVGGVLAHAACQARESGIPAVVLPDAMLVLRDGMPVRIDGETGIVELLEPQQASCTPTALTEFRCRA